MKALTRKLLRDLSAMKAQVFAIALVMTSGLAIFIALLSTLQSLEASQNAYYDRYRFADVFAQPRRAPETLATEIARIPGVQEVETRVVTDVVLDVPGLSEPATGRLISIPRDRPPSLNRVYLRRGRTPEPGRAGEVLVGEAFAEAHRLQPGDRVSAVIHGRWQPLTITGIALSPEYVYQIRPGSFFPDDVRFGVFWMERDEVAGALDMRDAFNDVSLELLPGASREEVIARLDHLLERYGGVGGYGRDKQLSNRYLTNEFAELRTNGTVVPGIFLAVAAFLLNIVLARTVATQRIQIAVLKALGYSSRSVALHYLAMAMWIVSIGSVLGALGGVAIGTLLTRMYTRFFRFPTLQFELERSTLLLAVLLGAATAAVGVLGAVRRVVRLPPAEAMQPEPPPIYRPTVIERLGLQRYFSQPVRIILRNLERRPLRALLSVLTMSLGGAILVVSGGQEDAIRHMIDTQFAVVQREDVAVAFIEPRGLAALYEVARLPGVMRAEPFREVPATLRFGYRTYDAAVMGLNRASELRQLVDRHQRVMPLPEEGVVLTAQLAKTLKVRRGDFLTVEVKEGARPVRVVPVVDLLDELTGVSAYMSLPALNRLMREGPLISGAFAEVDDREAEALYLRLKRTPGVTAIAVKRAALASFEDTFARYLRIFRAIQILFGVIIASGVTYNGARIALSERSRELASLRVIGLTRAEVSLILLGELAILTVAAIPVGGLIGYGMAALIALAYQTDLFRIPLVVHPATFAFAAIVIVVSAALSALVVRRKVDQLDLVAVLKTRE